MKITIENATITSDKTFNDFKRLLTTLREWSNTEIVLINLRLIKK